MKNYYLILVIPTKASQAQIKAAYKARLAEWNASDNHNISLYMDIEEAWENLGDEMRRKWYDDSFLSGLQQEEHSRQARINKIAQEVSDDLLKKKRSTSINKKIAVTGISGGALFFIMHLIVMVYHLAPPREPELKAVDITILDTSIIRQNMDSMIQRGFIDSISRKHNHKYP